MSPGRDVVELNANLRALGYGPGLRGDAFTAGTGSAIRRFQRAHGMAETGALLLGAVVFEPAPIRVTSVTPKTGSVVQAGAVLDVTSTRRQVDIELDASQQSNVAVGDPVVITLPDNTTTPGRVSFVGTVATAPADSQGDASDESPTVEVRVTPTRPRETGRLDQAPVSVAITTATVDRALVVPVNALLALAGGGYAVEEVARDGTHHLVPVELGLFDDSQGLVQVNGAGLAPGQRVVVPAQ
jgi:peptidoglycan hydrolase-like protein with peptidoglycan-binding domain